MINKKDKNIISVAHLRAIFEEMEKFDITHLVIQRDSESYEIIRGNNNETSIKTEHNLNKPEECEIAPSESDTVRDSSQNKDSKTLQSHDEEDDANIIEIKTPTVGTFYSSPSPESEPFIQIGKKVQKGDVLCIVEAMKSMNEIESDYDGIITEILVKNLQMVEYDQTLFKIKASDLTEQTNG